MKQLCHRTGGSGLWETFAQPTRQHRASGKDAPGERTGPPCGIRPIPLPDLCGRHCLCHREAIVQPAPRHLPHLRRRDFERGRHCLSSCKVFQPGRIADRAYHNRSHERGNSSPTVHAHECGEGEASIRLPTFDA